jgi:hypothetical protein
MKPQTLKLTAKCEAVVGGLVIEVSLDVGAWNLELLKNASHF